VLHIGGGGYLTGKTESRLYDYMALIKIAHYLNTEIILSGHTIGVWKNSSQKKWVKALNLVKYIGLRDNAQSVKDLKEIEISEKKIIPLFDDALFIETKKRSKDKKYIVINAHFWKTSYSEIKKEIIKIAKSADLLYEKGYKIILVSMTPGDKEALFAIQCNMKKPAEIFENMEEPCKTINIIKNADLCISMKHHPIIFSMSASIPTIGLYYEKYYKHKNEGAMELFGQKEWAVNITKETKESLIQKISELINKRDELRKKISIEKNKLKNDEIGIIKLYLSK
jgi:polysaccharide pyruvyl transferase WcaK-like protein